MFTKWLYALDAAVEPLPEKLPGRVSFAADSGMAVAIAVGVVVGALLITAAVLIGVAVYRSRKDR
ncbi:MAG: hypothetical protein IJN42_06080 [Clostridia bacterium]|nr:hypothetical protein [Clostridia bacterium]